MKKLITKIICLFCFLTFTLALKVGDQIELQNFLNARASANFKANSKNIQTILNSGTRGKVLEAKKLPSGNFGIKMKVENGSHSGKTYWVYYNVKSPMIKIYNKNEDEVKSDKMNLVENAKLTEAQVALRDPEEQMVEDVAKSTEKDLSLKTIKATLETSQKRNCDTSVSSELPAADPEAPMQKLADPKTLSIPLTYQDAIAPIKDALTTGKTTYCTSVSSSSTLSYCLNEAEIHRFNLTNIGSPKTNPKGSGAYRSFQFMAPQNARQDMALEVEESACTMGYDCNDSEWTMETVMVFFPRKVIPAVRTLESGAVEVTIPTGEKILFDGQTKEVTGGVLVETAPIDMSHDRFKRKFCSLQYKGSGIVVRADQRGESPRSAVVWGQKKTATVTWGTKNCKISPADLWEQKENDGGVNRYSKDEDFYSMLRTKCHWDVSAKDFP